MADVVIPDMTAASRLAVSNPPAPPNLLGLAAQALQMREQNNNLALFGAKQAAGQAWLNSLTGNGTVDPQQLQARLQNSGNPLVGMVAPDYVQAANNARNSTTQNAGMNLDQQLARAKGRGQVYKAWLALPAGQRTTQTLDAMINDAGEQFGKPDETQALVKSYNGMAPDQLDSVIRGNVALGGQDVGPGGAIVNTGMSQGVVNTNPYAPQPVGAPVGNSLRNTLSPGQAVQPITVNSAGGVPLTTTAAQVAQSGLPGAQNGVVTGQSTLEQAANAQSGSQYGSMASSIFANTQGLASTRAALASINSELGSANPGPIADTLAKVGGSLGQLGITGLTQATAYQLLNKGSAQSVIAQVGSGLGVPTDSKMGEIMAATPNGHMTPDAIRGAVGQIQGILDYKQAEAVAAQHAGVANNPASVSQFQNQWAQRFPNASVFQFQHMPPDLQKKYWQSMAPAERKAFYGQLNEATQLGYTNAPQ